ncbi:MAG: hypothetical protein AAGJ81_09805 [Verrucomicrobiota bacterium]
MSEDFSEFYEESDWEDVPEPVWKEFDWQRYLSESDGEIERFVQIYSGLKSSHERLDQVARHMGWDSGDWSIEDSGFASAERTDIPEPEQRGSIEFDPFTVHQHPVFLATRGLYLLIRREWESLLNTGLAPSDPQVSWMLARSIHEGEIAGVLATQAVEMGDVELAVCHFKGMLGELNRSLSILPEPESGRSRKVRSADRILRGALFDLREIALRVIYECRDEARRRPTDRD